MLKLLKTTTTTRTNQQKITPGKLDCLSCSLLLGYLILVQTDKH